MLLVVVVVLLLLLFLFLLPLLLLLPPLCVCVPPSLSPSSLNVVVLEQRNILAPAFLFNFLKRALKLTLSLDFAQVSSSLWPHFLAPSKEHKRGIIKITHTCHILSSPSTSQLSLALTFPTNPPDYLPSLSPSLPTSCSHHISPRTGWQREATGCSTSLRKIPSGV